MQAPHANPLHPPAGPPPQWMPEARPVDQLQSKFNQSLDFAAGGYGPPAYPPPDQYQPVPQQHQQLQQQQPGGYMAPSQGMREYGLTSPMRPTTPPHAPPHAPHPSRPMNPTELLPYDVQEFYPRTDQNPRGLPPPTLPDIGYPNPPAWQDPQFKLSLYPTAPGPFPLSALQEQKAKADPWQSSPRPNPLLSSDPMDLMTEEEGRRAREMVRDQAAVESICGPLYNHPNLPYDILSLTVIKSDPLRVRGI